MAMRQTGLELIIRDSGSTAVERFARSLDEAAVSAGRLTVGTQALEESLAAVTYATERGVQAQRQFRAGQLEDIRLLQESRVRLEALRAGKDNLGSSITRVSQKSIMLAGNLYNLSAGFDVLKSGTASATEKMFASAGAAASLTATTGSLAAGLGQLGLVASAGFGALAAAAVGTGLVLKTDIDLIAELIDVEAGAADAAARAGESTRHQGEALKFIAERMGTTVQGLRDQGISLENISRLAKEDPYGKLGQAVRAWRAEVETSKSVQLSAAELIARAQEASEVAMRSATDELLRQKGVVSEGEWWRAASAAVRGYDEAMQRFGPQSEVVRALGDEIVNLRDKAKDLGYYMPQAFADTAAAAAAATNAAREHARVVAELEAKHQRNAKAVEDNTKALAAQKTQAQATYAALVSGSEKWQNELEKIKSLMVKVDVTGSEEGRVDIDTSSEGFKNLAADIKAAIKASAGGAGAWLQSVLQNIAKGDLEAVGKIIASLQSMIAGFQSAGVNSGPLMALVFQLQQYLADAQRLAEPTPRAGGGPVAAGQPYLVGERAPEVFVPDRPGRIVADPGSFGPGAVRELQALRQEVAALRGALVSQPVVVEATMDGEAIATLVTKRQGTRRLAVGATR